MILFRFWLLFVSFVCLFVSEYIVLTIPHIVSSWPGSHRIGFGIYIREEKTSLGGVLINLVPRSHFLKGIEAFFF